MQLQKVTEWVNKNKVLAIVLGIFGFLLLKMFAVTTSNLTGATFDSGTSSFGSARNGKVSSNMMALDYAPTAQMEVASDSSRKYIYDSSISALVKDVDETVALLNEKVATLGGFTVNQHVNTPEFGKTGYVTVRVPNENKETFVSYVRDISVKIVSENITGYDITDQYTDTEERLRQQEALKAKLQAIMESANTVDEMIKVQTELTNVQSYIDGLKGSMKYLTESSNTTLYTINVSTDELALPFAPANPWRPDVVFKQAVRSLLTTFVRLGGLIIWVAVYSAIIIPAVLVFKAVKRKYSKKAK